MTNDRWRVEQGDCLAVLAGMDPDSVDAVVCDPPYSLGFMGAGWDTHDGRDDVAFGYYLAGLIDGEGCFRVQGGDRCEFTMKLRADDRAILEQTRRFLGHGRLQPEPAREGSMPQVRFVVDTKDGCAALCDTIDRFPLRAKKAIDYATWRDAVGEWTTRPRGNRWHGPADKTRLEALGQRLRTDRAYIEPAWSGHIFQDWCRRWAAECLRVLKPGGYLLAFGGTRTYHRLACAIEDAGFEIRDRVLTLNGDVLGTELDWIYGSGWPKSRDVGKAIDKAAGAEREVVGTKPGYMLEASPSDGATTVFGGGSGIHAAPDSRAKAAEITAPATPEAAQWEGYGTALKPAHEPIVVARKPFRGTVEAQVLATGTGALNIDACRIDGGEPNPSIARRQSKTPLGGTSPTGWKNRVNGDIYAADRPGEQLGRWPANVALIHTPDCERVGTRRVPTGTTVRRHADPEDLYAQRGYSGGLRRLGGEDVTHGDGDGLETIDAWDCAPGCPVAALDRLSGDVGASAQVMGHEPSCRDGSSGNAYSARSGSEGRTSPFYGDTGGASRFFYSGKTSPVEREAGLDDLEATAVMRFGEKGQGPQPQQKPSGLVLQRNIHPTVKPIDLMRWLVRLVTPPGAIVLDPFAGSGSTGCAAVLEGVRFVGIEQDARHVDIARARIRFWGGFPVGTPTERVLAQEATRRRDAADADERRRELASTGQLDLLGEL